MATGGSQAQLTESTCSVCFEHYRLPKVLPCSHVYCHLCLRSMATAKDSGFSCPICRQEVNLTAQGVDDLQTHLQLARSRETLLETFHSAMKDNGDMKEKSQISTEGAVSSVVIKRKSLPREMYNEIRFSENSKTELKSLTLSAENKLWVRYQPPGLLVSLLSVYDCGGKSFGPYVEESVTGSSLTCLGDVPVSPLTWRWIDPDGQTGSFDLPPNDWALCVPSHSLLTSYFMLLSPSLLMKRLGSLCTACSSCRRIRRRSQCVQSSHRASHLRRHRRPLICQMMEDGWQLW